MRNTIRAAFVAATILLVGLTGSASAYPSGSDANHPSNWEDQFPHPAECVKYEAGDAEAPGTWYAASGIRLDPAAHWEALILKSSTDNRVFVHPTAGNLYLTLSGQAISHIIVCTGEVPPSSPSPSPEPSFTPEPTSSPSPSTQPTPSPLPSSTPSPSPSATPVPSPSVTPTPTPSLTPSPTPEPSSQPTPSPDPSPSSSTPPSTSTPSSPPSQTLPPTDTASEEAGEAGVNGILAAIGAVALLYGLSHTLNQRENTPRRRR